MDLPVEFRRPRNGKRRRAQFNRGELRRNGFSSPERPAGAKGIVNEHSAASSFFDCGGDVAEEGLRSIAVHLPPLLVRENIAIQALDKGLNLGAAKACFVEHVDFAAQFLIRNQIARPPPSRDGTVFFAGRLKCAAELIRAENLCVRPAAGPLLCLCCNAFERHCAACQDDFAKKGSAAVSHRWDLLKLYGGELAGPYGTLFHRKPCLNRERTKCNCAGFGSFPGDSARP